MLSKSPKGDKTLPKSYKKGMTFEGKKREPISFGKEEKTQGRVW